MSAGSDGNELLTLLQGCEAGMSLEARVKACRKLLDLVENQRVRDVDKLPWKIYGFLVDSVRLGWQHPEVHLVKDAQACLAGLTGIPEFEANVAGDVVDDGFLLELCDRFHRGVASERAFLRDTLHWAYASFPRKRSLLRQKIGAVLSHFVRTPSSSFHVAELLQVLRHIIKGFPENLTQVHQSLLTAVLLPLHEPNEMAVWSVQQPLLDIYHEELVGCIVPLLERQPELVLTVYEAVVATWPRGFNSNTPKEVLLLHELETFFKFVAPEASGAVLHVIMPKVCGCLQVDNSRVVERTLYLFKNDKFVDMLTENSRSTFPQLLAALLRGGERSWNPTVNKMTAHILETLESKDAAVFAAACESGWGDVSPPASTADTRPLKPTTKCEAPPQPESKGRGRLPPTTLKAAMGSWRPSTSRRPGQVDARETSKNPPAAVTGVAPWAFKAPAVPARSKAAGARQTAANSAQRSTPPIPSLKRIRLDAPESGEGIRDGELDYRQTSAGTHVDTAPGSLPPLAIGAAASVSHDDPRNIPASESCEGEDGANTQTKSAPPLSTSLDATSDKDSVDRRAASPGDMDREEGPGLRRVRDFISAIKPKEEDGPSGPWWQEMQLEPTPTLLPDLRFHDLVFGHDLGQGSFSVVKYARHITKGRAQSQWPEYAVKVISTAKIQELTWWSAEDPTKVLSQQDQVARTIATACVLCAGHDVSSLEELNYEKSVTNEIACLRVFSHPGIARLISAFRWRDGAYLVLEYASRGDLHSHIKQHGSLSEASTRFVVGEVVAALCSIHDRGFVFGDLKPENVIITELGHIKVADFGACRPVSADAKNVLNNSRDALRTLRDGDWRVAAGLPPNPLYTVPIGQKASGRDDDSDSDSDDDAGGQGAEGSDHEGKEDVRAEGTAAYMPPEVARGGAPGLGADSWALGCVTFLCLAGRPPIFAETDEIILARVVRFASDNASDLPTLPDAVSEPPRSLVRSLMEPDPKIRLSVEQAAKHEFLVEGGVDVFSLHRGEPVKLAQGTVAPTPNAAWSRRQNSMIWAPMPQEYKFEAVSSTLVIIPETSVERAAFFRRPFSAVREPPRAR